jgi:DNA-binding NtrC family response regulator
MNDPFATTGEDRGRGGATSTEAPSSVLPVEQSLKESLRILVVDDEHTLRESCASLLGSEGYRVEVCGRGDDAQDLLRRTPFDIVLIDLYMSQVSGMELLKTALQASPETVAIVMTGNPSIESSIEALRAGAWDYLPKPFSATHLQILIGRAAHAVMVARESAATDQEIKDQHGHSEMVTLLGVSPAFRKMIDLARKVAPTDASVFLTGESGSGKEVIAQFIHYHSRRSSRELVPLNCAALPETLLESEMFGHVEGAFTGAVREKKGLLEVANGGTLFLDELTEMPQSIQAKLLRVIQDGVVRRLGSTMTDAVVNVRFIAGTNRDPADTVRSGQLRQDLYYRLRVVPIHIPPLRDRPEDIPVLADYFLDHFWKLYRAKGDPKPGFSESALEALLNHPWRGNVRELRNVMEHAVVLLQPGVGIEPEDIPFIEGGPGSDGGDFSLARFAMEGEYHVARENVLAEFEKTYLARVVRQAKGNISDAARIAGVDRTTLYRLMQKHGIDRDLILHDPGQRD